MLILLGDLPFKRTSQGMAIVYPKIQTSVVENLTSNIVQWEKLRERCNLFLMGSPWPTCERPIAQPIGYGF